MFPQGTRYFVAIILGAFRDVIIINYTVERLGVGALQVQDLGLYLDYVYTI